MNGGVDLEHHNRKKGIEVKFTQIYNAYKSAIYKFCLARLKGDSQRAEDCMQNAFMVLYKKLLNSEEIENPRAFLYKTAQNFVMKCFEEISKENNKIVPITDYRDELVDHQNQVDNYVDFEVLYRKLTDILTPDEQMLLQLKYIEDLTIEQTAQKLKISKPAAAKRLQRLREKIKSYFGENFNQEERRKL